MSSSVSHPGLGAASGAVPPRAFLICGLASLAGLMFGLDIGVIAGALDFIRKAFNLGDLAQGWIVSVMTIGAAVGAASAGTVSYQLGRKKSLLIGAVLFVAGALLCSLAPSVTVLLIGRALLGLAIGVVSFTGPLYISEVAPSAWRGAMVSLYQFMLTLGIVLAFLSDTLLTASGNWRLMLGIIALPGLLFLVAVLFMPESPRWFLLRGRTQEARTVLNELRSSSAEVEREIGEIGEQLSVRQLGSTLFRTNPNFRRSVALGVGLQLVQQFTGMNVIMYYAPKIFGLAGFGATAAAWATTVTGLVNVVATLLAIGFADSWGRRRMLNGSFVVMAVSMAIVGVMLSMGIHDQTSRYLLVAMVLIFVAGFAAAPGPLVWTLCSEIQPLQGRDFGVAVSTFANWGGNFVIGITFLPMLTHLGQSATFGVFAVLNALFVVFVLLLVPETKGVSLEAIEHKLMQGLPLRRIGR